jgi:hypothetical protein
MARLRLQCIAKYALLAAMLVACLLSSAPTSVDAAVSASPADASGGAAEQGGRGGLIACYKLANRIADEVASCDATYAECTKAATDEAAKTKCSTEPAPAGALPADEDPNEGGRPDRATPSEQAPKKTSAKQMVEYVAIGLGILVFISRWCASALVAFICVLFCVAPLGGASALVMFIRVLCTLCARKSHCLYQCANTLHTPVIVGCCSYKCCGRDKRHVQFDAVGHMNGYVQLRYRFFQSLLAFYVFCFVFATTHSLDLT